MGGSGERCGGGGAGEEAAAVLGVEREDLGFV